MSAIKKLTSISYASQMFRVKVQRVQTPSVACVSKWFMIEQQYGNCNFTAYQLMLLMYMVWNTWYCYWVVFLLTSGLNVFPIHLDSEAINFASLSSWLN